ncbi:hypothetical protein EV200_101760 [Pedobacter psychrotolerans]|uniref:Uncharacterized protein n=1 Tax=Pedobacter psychrotolerans TaxID=1843235 RepID=A0A4R2HMD2_9SPHI|nr:hypothetical protein [Pedobacter psychrotolerans]TCO31310.1 hypothetical protein EV200_101760 [Pedobacter psychrotolerans]GGE40655.1 hypothetical protein GCM10011413_03110 [Pedobacter psychrotolerans]
MKKESLSLETHQKIISAAELLLKREQGKEVSLVDAMVWMTEIASSENLDRVTDIYIYEEGYSDTEKALKHTILHAITSIVAFEYQERNINYLKNLILSDHSKLSERALEYFLKIGCYHEKFKDAVLAFVETNLFAFSENQLNISAFYLLKLYKEEKRVTGLFHQIRILNDKKYRNKEGVPIESENVDEALKEIRIGKVFSEILKGNPADNITFSKYVYQEEFFEGLRLYKKYKHSATPDQLDTFVNILTILADEMANFTHALAKNAMDAGFYLSNFDHQYQFNPEIRKQLQELIDLLNAKKGKAKDIANLCSAKAKISCSVPDLLKKEEIGEDMLQMAKSFENVASHVSIAIKLYESIMNDFQSESSRLSSGLFPEIAYIDSRPEREIEIFEMASAAHQKLISQNNKQNTSPVVKKEDLVSTFQSSKGEIKNTLTKTYNVFFARIKRLFKN